MDFLKKEELNGEEEHKEPSDLGHKIAKINRFILLAQIENNLDCLLFYADRPNSNFTKFKDCDHLYLKNHKELGTVFYCGSPDLVKQVLNERGTFVTGACILGCHNRKTGETCEFYKH